VQASKCASFSFCLWVWQNWGIRRFVFSHFSPGQSWPTCPLKKGSKKGGTACAHCSSTIIVGLRVSTSKETNYYTALIGSVICKCLLLRASVLPFQGVSHSFHFLSITSLTWTWSLRAQVTITRQKMSVSGHGTAHNFPWHDCLGHLYVIAAFWTKGQRMRWADRERDETLLKVDLRLWRAEVTVHWCWGIFCSISTQIDKRFWKRLATISSSSLAIFSC